MKIFMYLFFILLYSCSSTRIVSIDDESRKKEDIFKEREEVNSSSIFFKDKEKIDLKILQKTFIINKEEASRIIKSIVFFNNYEMLYFIDNNIKINYKIIKGISNYLVDSAHKEDLKIFNYILKKGVIPNGEDSFERNLLHVALEKDSIYLLEISIKYNISPNTKGFIDRGVFEYSLNPKVKNRLIEYIKLYNNK